MPATDASGDLVRHVQPLWVVGDDLSAARTAATLRSAWGLSDLLVVGLSPKAARAILDRPGHLEALAAAIERFALPTPAGDAPPDADDAADLALAQREATLEEAARIRDLYPPDPADLSADLDAEAGPHDEKDAIKR